MNISHYTGAAAAFRGVLADLQTANHVAADGAEAKSRLRGGSREHLNYVFSYSSPLQRLSENLGLYPAAARFLWMMSANNRLADIAFHVPKVSQFTDDGLTVPGSNYGMRLRQPLPGQDQVLGAIDRLKTEQDSRRAAVIIFQAVDALRKSNDIPCAFGLFFHNRNGVLLTTVIMRSNNAFRLLPFNLFEFSMLAEVVAVEAGLDFGPITHFAGSMHLYDADEVAAKEFLATEPAINPFMAQMPREISPLEQLKKLAIFETDLRQGFSDLHSETLKHWFDRAEKELLPYWAQFAFIILAGVAAKKDQEAFSRAFDLLEPQFKPFMSNLRIHSSPVSEPQFPDLFEKGVSAPVVLPFHRRPSMQKFSTFAEEYEKRTCESIGAARLLKAQAIIAADLAARGQSDILTEEAFLEALKKGG